MAKPIAEDAEVAEARRGKEEKLESPVGGAPGLWVRSGPTLSPTIQRALLIVIRGCCTSPSSVALLFVPFVLFRHSLPVALGSFVLVPGLGADPLRVPDSGRRPTVSASGKLLAVAVSLPVGIETLEVGHADLGVHPPPCRPPGLSPCLMSGSGSGGCRLDRITHPDPDARMASRTKPPFVRGRSEDREWVGRRKAPEPERPMPQPPAGNAGMGRSLHSNRHP